MSVKPCPVCGGQPRPPGVLIVDTEQERIVVLPRGHEGVPAFDQDRPTPQGMPVRRQG